MDLRACGDPDVPEERAAIEKSLALSELLKDRRRSIRASLLPSPRPPTTASIPEPHAQDDGGADGEQRAIPSCSTKETGKAAAGAADQPKSRAVQLCQPQYVHLTRLGLWAGNRPGTAGRGRAVSRFATLPRPAYDAGPLRLAFETLQLGRIGSAWYAAARMRQEAGELAIIAARQSEHAVARVQRTGRGDPATRMTGMPSLGHLPPAARVSRALGPARRGEGERHRSKRSITALGALMTSLARQGPEARAKLVPRSPGPDQRLIAHLVTGDARRSWPVRVWRAGAVLAWAASRCGEDSLADRSRPCRGSRPRRRRSHGWRGL